MCPLLTVVGSAGLCRVLVPCAHMVSVYISILQDEERYDGCLQVTMVTGYYHPHPYSTQLYSLSSSDQLHHVR